MGASISSLPARDQPLSEQYRVIAKKWADADSAAHIMEEMKTTTLEQRKCKLIDANPGMAEAKAERLAKAAPDWEEYVRHMCKARSQANLLRQQLEYIRMKFSEWQSAEANARQEGRLNR